MPKGNYHLIYLTDCSQVQKGDLYLNKPSGVVASIYSDNFFVETRSEGSFSVRAAQLEDVTLMRQGKEGLVILAGAPPFTRYMNEANLSAHPLKNQGDLMKMLRGLS